MSPFVGMDNNPISLTDPLGLSSENGNSEDNFTLRRGGKDDNSPREKREGSLYDPNKPGSKIKNKIAGYRDSWMRIGQFAHKAIEAIETHGGTSVEKLNYFNFSPDKKIQLLKNKSVEDNVKYLISESVKIGDEIDGDEMKAIHSKASYAVDKMIKKSDNKFEVDPTFIGRAIVPSGTTVTISKGKASIIMKANDKYIINEVEGYWMTFNGLKIENQSKVFINENKMYYRKPEDNVSHLTGVIKLK
jgi:hypothetical protein